MTIFEQILAGLQQKFSGVDTATLTRIATKKAEGVTDETKVNSIVEGISFQDVLTSYGDFRAGDARITAVANYEKKHNLKDGKPIENPNPEPPKPEPKPDEKPDIAKLIADGIAAGIKPFSDKLAAFEAKEAQAQRMAQISSVAKKYGIPDFMLKDRTIPENTDLDTYMKDVKQEMTNAGFQFNKPPETAEQKLEKETSEFAKMIENDTKQIVEQQKK
ncbi:hypothetical protein [uncultured Phocaeicola sp.]|uniref:hypothetical protein n=1 Tax=uncultured Phocaeicola sp. TaxID=990718 RepID=UPI0025EC7A37|nr:hypothetical protein [uncultured Phocaeicola sp.]